MRLLLLTLAALWLAQPVLTGAPSCGSVAAAVVPGAAPVEGTVWLAPGFPPVSEPVPAGPVPAASLVRELDARLPEGASLTIRVPAVIEGADAERPRLSRRVEWRVMPGSMAATPAVAARAPQLAVRDGGAAGGLPHRLRRGRWDRPISAARSGRCRGGRAGLVRAR
ncbi:hypothetical protein AB5I41_12040 [Sphingomonas sp. MMS24-JH45]